MAEPGRTVTGPNGESVFVRDGKAFTRDRSGNVYTIDEADIGRAMSSGAQFASPEEVFARDRARANADFRAAEGTGGSVQAGIEAAGRSLYDAALSPWRAMGGEAPTSAAALAALGGASEEEQLRRAEAFSEPLLGGTNVGQVSAELAMLFGGVGIGSKALRGAGLSQRMLGMGAVDAATGALSGGAAATEEAWRRGEEVDSTSLLVGMGQGAILNASLGALGTGVSEVLQRGRLALGSGADGAAKALRTGAKVADFVEVPGLRIRPPTGAGTPGAGFGMLRKSGSLGGALRTAADALESGASKRMRLAREATALREAAEAEARAAAKRVEREVTKAETGLSRAQAAEARAGQSALATEQRSARSLDRVRRTAFARDESEAFKASRDLEKAKAEYKSAADKVNSITVAQGAEVRAMEDKIAEVRATHSLNHLDRQLLAARARDLEDDLLDLKSRHSAARKGADDALASKASAVQEAEGRVQQLAKAPPGHAAVVEAEARHESTVAAARKVHGATKQRLFDAERSLERALQEKGLTEAKLHDIPEPELGPIPGGESPLLQAGGRAAEMLGRASDITRRGAAFLAAAYNAHDNVQRNIDRAIMVASGESEDMWEPIGGAGDYERFPDGQFQRPGETRREAFLARTAEIARYVASPELMIEPMARNVAGLSALGPQTQASVLERSMRAVAYLSQYAQVSRNPRNPLIPTDTVGPLDEASIDMFERSWNAVMFPGTVIDEVATWTLSTETIAAAGAVHPELLSTLATSMMERVFSGQFEPNLHQRIQLSGLTGIPDLSLQPEFQLSYDSYLATALQQMQPARPAGRPGRPSGSPTLSQQHRTLSEQVLSPGR